MYVNKYIYIYLSIYMYTAPWIFISPERQERSTFSATIVDTLTTADTKDILTNIAFRDVQFET